MIPQVALPVRHLPSKIPFNRIEE